MSITAIVLVAIAVLVVLTILATTALSPSKREARRLRHERRRAAEHHRAEAEQRRQRATLAAQRAEAARVQVERAAQEARLERERASLHEHRADITERGLADGEPDEQHRVRDRDGAPADHAAAGRADAGGIGPTRTDDERHGRFVRDERVEQDSAHRAPRS